MTGDVKEGDYAMKTTFAKYVYLLLVLPFIASLNFAWADNNFYVISAGKKAKRTILVSPKSTETASGTALLNAINGITDASAAKPYLIHIEPGVYNIGTSSLQLKSYVDIEGSGEDVTIIKGTDDSLTAGVVIGSFNAEIRFLFIVNEGGGSNAVGIHNSGTSPRITHVTAWARNASNNNYYGGQVSY